MTTESEWVEQVLRPDLHTALQACGDAEWRVGVESGKKLTYANEILSYRADDPGKTLRASYETDVLVYDKRENGEWIPRIVLECKKGGVTTHDALTYSTKAATHKHVHPYLRYGVLVADFGPALPGRLIRHGAYFDFMVAWGSEIPKKNEWAEFVKILQDEIKASRTLHALLSDSRSKTRKKFASLHRPLRLN